MKIVEVPIFIPYTKDSQLRKGLQKVDDTLGETKGTPSARFVERCGGRTVIDHLGQATHGQKNGSAKGRAACPAREGTC